MTPRTQFLLRRLLEKNDGKRNPVSATCVHSNLSSWTSVCMYLSKLGMEEALGEGNCFIYHPSVPISLLATSPLAIAQSRNPQLKRTFLSGG